MTTACMARISTGSKSLDNILGGGIESKAITELYGETGSGKTQLCHTLCVMATQDKSEYGITSKAIYIDTEGKFRPERIASIAISRGFNVDEVLSNILYERAVSASQQGFIIERAQSLMDKDNSIILLIVDSVISNYRAEYSKVSMLPERQKKLYKFMCDLSGLAQRYNIAAVVTNQVNFSGNSGAANPSGGRIIAHASTYHISLKLLPNNSHKIAAKIIASPYHPENDVCITINEKGIDDVL
jgi:DNA repair protein RadA